jgi:hypothetical protein
MRPLLLIGLASGFSVEQQWIDIPIIGVLVTAIVSGVQYVWIWGAWAWSAKRRS